MTTDDKDWEERKSRVRDEAARKLDEWPAEGTAMFDRDELKFIVPFGIINNQRRDTYVWKLLQLRYGGFDLNIEAKIRLYCERLFDELIHRDQEAVSLMGDLLDHAFTDRDFVDYVEDETSRIAKDFFGAILQGIILKKPKS